MSLLALMLFSQVQVQIALPTIRFPAPPALVVVAPGIQVVPEHDEEIFFTDGFYWHRRDGHWFRSKDHEGHWAVVEEKIVPPGLIRMRPGEYRHYKHIEHEEKKIEHEERKIEREEHKIEKHEKHHK
jgi:hypothetical protein